MDPRLAAYLERLGLDAPPAADATGLGALQSAHRQSIPFENFDIHFGRGIAIDGDSVFAKLVTGRRGGYCFEHNRLLADMLALLGIPTRPLLARVRLGPADGHPARSHVLLLADMGGEPWIADAGFGGSHIPALPLADGATATAADRASYRLRRIGEPGALAGEWLLERAAPDEEWQPQYSFDLGEVSPDDLEQANHWTATAPGSRFVNLHIATLALPDGFASLVDKTLKIASPGRSAELKISDRDRYSETLREMFGLDLDPADLARLTLF